jgi:hypothetical protein
MGLGFCQSDFHADAFGVDLAGVEGAVGGELLEVAGG